MLKIFLIVVLVLFALVGFSVASAFIQGFIKGLRTRNKVKKAKEDSLVKAYFERFDANDPLAVIDETPRSLEFGEGLKKRTYLLKPLKYRQVTRLCVLFAHVLEKLHKEQLDLNNADMMIGKIIEMCEDDFFKALSHILYFSKNEKEDNEETIAKGVINEFQFIKDEATLAQLTKALETIVMQNDIKRALEGFGRLSLGGKKKAE